MPATSGRYTRARAAPTRPALLRTAGSRRPPDPAFPPAAPASPDGRRASRASGAARAPAESARRNSTHPLPFPPRSNVPHARGRTSPRTAPPPPPPPFRPRRSGRGGRRRGGARGIGRRGAAAVQMRRVRIEPTQVIAGLLHLLLVADRTITVHQ